MPTLRCLYLENEDNDYEFFKQVFQRSLLATRADPNGIDLQFERARRVEDAWQILDERGDELDIFFVDLLLPESDSENAKESPAGLQAVKSAAKYTKLAIVAISKAEGQYPGPRVDFEKLGVGVYVDKRHIRQYKLTYEDVRAKIEAAFELRGRYLGTAGSHRIARADAHRLELEAIVERIGEDALGKLLRLASPASTWHEIYYVAPGYSGAVVLGVRGYQGGNHPQEQLIIKCSRDVEKLARELSASPTTAEVAADLYVPYISQVPWASHGWYAIGARFASETKTLHEWLTGKPSRAEVGGLLEELFIGGLAQRYSTGGPVKRNVIDTLLGTSRRLARLQLGLDQVGGVCAAAGAKCDIGLLTGFLRNAGQIGSRSPATFPSSTFVCMSHGDLHARNILVGRANRPRLIDTADRQDMHWSRDCARLCADLWMNTIWSGNSAHFWEKLGLWNDRFKAWMSGQQGLGQGKSCEAAFDVLDWVYHNLETIFANLCGNDLRRWEFKLALALELLDFASYADTPMPKRCFGLLAAAELLQHVADSVPQVH